MPVSPWPSVWTLLEIAEHLEQPGAESLAVPARLDLDQDESTSALPSVARSPGLDGSFLPRIVAITRLMEQ